MSRRPWFPWYPSDWRSEPRLKLVSRAARSLWVDMLGLMHEAEPYGHLIVAGISPDARQLAVLLGDPEGVIKKLLRELETAGVFDRSADGTIVSRRMVRDNIKSRERSERGKAGGNPALIGKDKPPDNETVKREDNHQDKPQIPDTIIHSSERESPQKRAQARKATRWKADQAIPPEWLAEAQELRKTNNLHPIDLRLEAQQFANFWAAKAGADGAKLDWRATWRNWILRSRAPVSNAPIAPAPAGELGDRERWLWKVQAFRDKGIWVEAWGPKPREPGCEVPQPIIDEVLGRAA